MNEYGKPKFYKLGSYIIEYTERNAENEFRPVAVGRYGIRTRESIYSKELAKDYSKNKLIFKDTLTVGMGSVQIDIGVLTDDVTYSVSPAYHTYKISGIDSAYLRYCLECRNQDMFQRYVKRGSRQGKTIDLKRWLDYEIPVYEHYVQLEIVDRIERVKEIISLRQQELQKLDELVKARFVEMFGMPGSDEKGWGLRKLGDCCELNPKKSKDSRLVSGLKVSFVPMPAVSENGAIDPSEVKLYDEVKTGFTYFAENDVLMAKITPCMENGKGAVAVGLTNGIGFGSTEFHVLRPIEDISNPYWIYIMTVIKAFREDAASNMTGSAGQRRVPATFLDNFKVALPPIELQEQFASFVKQINKSKLIVQKSLDETQLLFDSLMQKYFG